MLQLPLTLAPQKASQVWSWQKATKGKTVGTLHLGRVSPSEVVHLQREMGSVLKVASSLAFEESFLHLWFALQQGKIKEGFQKNAAWCSRRGGHSSHKTPRKQNPRPHTFGFVSQRL